MRFFGQAEEDADYEAADDVDGERSPGKGRDRYDVGQFSGQEAQACADKAAEACNNRRLERIDRVFMLSGWRNKFDAIARRTSVCPAPPGSLAYYLDFEEIRIGVPLFRRDPAGSVR